MPSLAGKLAEVAAFSVVGQEMMNRDTNTAADAFGDEAADIQRVFSAQYDAVKRSADVAKLDRTARKLQGMMETYIGDNWKSATELLEWSGFFFGAGQIHWALVAEMTDDEQLASFARRQANQYGDWLEYACRRIGRT